jgi:hypothetical protein
MADAAAPELVAERLLEFYEALPGMAAPPLSTGSPGIHYPVENVRHGATSGVPVQLILISTAS